MGAFIVTFFGLSKKVTKETRFRRQWHSHLRRRGGAHGQSGSHVGAANYWQRLQLPGPLTLYAQNRSHRGNRSLRLSLLLLCRQVPAPPLGTGGAESSVPSELQALSSRGRGCIQRARCRWTHRRFNGMHKPGTVVCSLINEMNAGDRSRLPWRFLLDHQKRMMRRSGLALLPRFRVIVLDIRKVCLRPLP